MRALVHCIRVLYITSCNLLTGRDMLIHLTTTVGACLIHCLLSTLASGLIDGTDTRTANFFFNLVLSFLFGNYYSI